MPKAAVVLLAVTFRTLALALGSSQSTRSLAGFRLPESIAKLLSTQWSASRGPETRPFTVWKIATPTTPMNTTAASPMTASTTFGDFRGCGGNGAPIGGGTWGGGPCGAGP